MACGGAGTIAALAAVNEVAALRSASKVLAAGGCRDRMLGVLLACIAKEWARSSARPPYAPEVLLLADEAIGGAR